MFEHAKAQKGMSPNKLSHTPQPAPAGTQTSAAPHTQTIHYFLFPVS